MYSISHLENGLTVATAEMPHMVSASVGLWTGVGSRYEPPELNGVCHFIEHLLFKGTRRRSARQISEAVEGLGGYLNAFTSEESTCFHAKAGGDHFEDVLDVLLDMFSNSLFRPREIQKEREVIKEEIAMYLDEPQHLVQELFNAILWPGHPLGRPITGSPRTLDGLGRPQLTGFLRDYYVAGRTVLVAAGNITHRKVVRAAARAGRIRPGAARPCAPAKWSQNAPVVRVHPKVTEQTQIALGFRTCSRHHADRFSLRLLHTILGENMSSRLFQVIREDRGLAYSIYSSPSYFSDTGDLVIYAGLEQENLPRVLRLVVRELARLRQKAPGRAEMARARDYVLGQIDLSLENTESQMNWVGEQWLGYGRIHPPSLLKRRLAQVTPQQIQAAAKKYLVPCALNLAIVSPMKRNPGFDRVFARLGDS